MSLLTRLKSILTEYAGVWRTVGLQCAAFARDQGQTLGPALYHLPRQGVDYVVDSAQYYRHNPSVLKNEILSGISIAVMQVPESTAFAFVARILPTRGLFSTFFIGLFGGLFTSLPGLVSGIAGGMVAILTEVTADDGPLADKCLVERVEYAFGIMVICALFQLLFGVLQITKFIKLIPHPVMVGFMNGLAIIVFKAQLTAFKTDDPSAPPDPMAQAARCPAPDYDPPKQQRWLALGELETWLVLIVVVLAMAIMILQPKIKGRLRIWRFSLSANTIPPAFTAMVVTTVIGNVLYNQAFGQHIHLIGDVATFSGQVPQAHVPNVPWGSGEFWSLGLRYGLLLALVGSIESIMTWKLCQQIIDKPVPIAQSKWEVYSQGIGNLFSSFFGSIGGSVMVGQSIVNFTNGARGRVSTTVAAIIIFIIASVAGKAIEIIPLATLTGILFAVVLNMFEWKTFQYLFRLSLPLTDLAAIILVTILAVTTDLAIAVLIGIAWCSVCFAWKSSTHAQVRQVKGMQPDMVVTLKQAQMRMPQQLQPQTTAVVKLEGIVFFGSTADIMQYFLEFAWEGYQVVMLDLSKAVFYDSSGVEVLRAIAHEVITKHQRQLILIDASETNYGLLGRSHLLRSIVFELTPAELTDDKDSSTQTAIMAGMELDPTKFEEARQATTGGWMGNAEDRRLATNRLYEDNHLYHRTSTHHSV